ncbi:MAG: spore maturation protein [Clostridiales bacterium]|nr:spore maturation protein [Clostridiales bacterium]
MPEIPVYPIIHAAVGVLRASGTLDILASLLAPVTRLFGFPEEALPLTLMRLVSSSAATGLQLDIYANYGPDSFIGRFVSVMMSSTETVFYTFSVYFLHVGITKTRYTLSGAIFANIVSIVTSLVITIMVFGR